MAVKYVFVTGGVVSGLGKGITAASLGRLMKALTRNPMSLRAKSIGPFFRRKDGEISAEARFR